MTTPDYRRHGVAESRRDFTRSNKKLRRARNLYVFFLRHHIQCREDVNDIATIMLAEGLYAPTCSKRDVEYAIIRKLYRFSGLDNTRRGHILESWWGWLQKYSWGRFATPALL